jgi:tetratricopeptide (TPR) repeat protein
MKNWKLLGGILLVIVVVIIVFTTQSKPDLIEGVEPQLGSVERGIFEQQLTDTQKNVDEINNETSVEERATRYSILARGHFQLGHYKEAREWFERAVETKKNIPVYLEYFNLLEAMQDYEEARDVARASLEIYPLNIDIWRRLIALEQLQFEADDARVTSLYLEAIEKSEQQNELIADYARILEKRGDKQGALEYWRRAVQRAPDFAFYQQQVLRLEAELK